MPLLCENCNCAIRDYDRKISRPHSHPIPEDGGSGWVHADVLDCLRAQGREIAALRTRLNDAHRMASHADAMTRPIG